jgi:hypothetical protein
MRVVRPGKRKYEFLTDLSEFAVHPGRHMDLMATSSRNSGTENPAGTKNTAKYVIIVFPDDLNEPCPQI